MTSTNKTIIKLPPNVEILKSKAIDCLFSVIRNKDSSNEDYVFYCDRLLRIICEEGLARLSTKTKEISTPCGKWIGPVPISPNQCCCVSIVRSGDIFLEAMRKITPGIAVGKILLQRNEETEDKKPIHFYTKLPKNISLLKVILVDPMIGTGGSSKAAIKILIENGVKQQNIIFLNTICCPEGVNALYNAYPKVRIISASCDPKLNNDKYIVPGIGDFGDRYYRTE